MATAAAKQVALSEQQTPFELVPLWAKVVKQVQSLEQVPSVPTLLVPLMKCVSQPSDSIDITYLVKLISMDSALTAQCLRVTNSPLFAMHKSIETTHEAVTLLGVKRVREIATSCCLFSAFSSAPRSAAQDIFWKHSLAVALVSREIALMTGYSNPDEAYLAGLLHDLGLMVQLAAFPGDHALVVAIASQDHESLHLAEQRELGFDHCAVGHFLARNWNLAPQMQAVIAHHHNLQVEASFQELVCIVSLADILCRSHNMGYGYDEKSTVNLDSEPAWAVIRGPSRPKPFDAQAFSTEIGAHLVATENLLGGLASILG